MLKIADPIKPMYHFDPVAMWIENNIKNVLSKKLPLPQSRTYKRIVIRTRETWVHLPLGKEVVVFLKNFQREKIKSKQDRARIVEATNLGKNPGPGIVAIPSGNLEDATNRYMQYTIDTNEKTRSPILSPRS